MIEEALRHHREGDSDGGLPQSVAHEKEDTPQKDFKITLAFKYLYNEEFPLGVGILESYLTQNGYEVEQHIIEASKNRVLETIRAQLPTGGRFIDRSVNAFIMRYVRTGRGAYLRQALDREIEDMKAGEQDLIGFSVMSKLQLPFYLALARRIKERHKDTKIVLGGAYVKLFHNLIDLKKYLFIDYVVTSDGEIALLKLCRYLSGEIKDISEVPSL